MEPPPTRRRRGPWIAVAVLALLIIAAAAVGAVLVNRHHNTAATSHCPSGVPVLPGQLETDMTGLQNLVCKAASTDVLPKAAKALKPYLVTVRQAASGTSRRAVRTDVQSFDTEVGTLAGDKEISPTRAQAIQDQAGVLETDFNKMNKPAPPPTSAPASSSPPPSASPTPTVTVTVTPTLPVLPTGGSGSPSASP
jgi:hypothetical protein